MGDNTLLWFQAKWFVEGPFASYRRGLLAESHLNKEDVGWRFYFLSCHEIVRKSKMVVPRLSSDF